MSAAQRVCALTGANGYVGSILRHALESSGWKVVSLSRREMVAEDEIPWSLGTEPGSGSGPAQSPIEDALRSRAVSALVHAAWDLRLVRPSDLWHINVEGSLRLFAQAQAAGVPRVVFISTISAFDGARSHYGQTKLAVERAAADCGGAVIRPGLVYGAPPGGQQSGGMFGALRQQASHSSILSIPLPIPLIGDGSYPQYLVHEEDLAAAVVRAVSMEQLPREPVTVANPRPWPLRALIETIAQMQGNTPHFISVPWKLIYNGLRVAEAIGLRPRFRSDSVLSLVYQNPNPEWNAGLLGVEPRPFEG